MTSFVKKYGALTVGEALELNKIERRRNMTEMVFKAAGVVALISTGVLCAANIASPLGAVCSIAWVVALAAALISES